jgi:hypothetical protein
LGGRDEEESVYTGANHRQTQGSQGFSELGEHDWGGQPETWHHGADVPPVEQARRLKELEKKNVRLIREIQLS